MKFNEMIAGDSKRPYGFVKAMEFTLLWEVGKDRKGNLKADGGYTNDPRDTGGETKWGISKRAHPGLDIKNLTIEQAFDIYKENYWDVYVGMRPVSANLSNLPTALAVAVFDAGVNCGTANALRWLGKALENKNPVKVVNDLRGAYYFNLVSANKDKYGWAYKGWSNRLNDLRKYCEIVEKEAQSTFEVVEKLKSRKRASP
jgi:hypothetical protein